MNRTDEQIKADEALTTAIQNAVQVYGLNDEGATLTDFMVLTAMQQITDDGVVRTTHPVLLPDGDIPWYRIYGLLTIHAKIADATLMSGGDNG